VRLPRKKGKLVHTAPNVYREMILQVARDYPGLPDVRTLSMDEIRFFYDGLRAELRRYSSPTKPGG
jgi:hypothetical protein